MEAISVPPEFMQGWYRDNWFNIPDLALRAGGSPHSPNEARAPHNAYSTPGVGPIGTVTASGKNAAASGDYRATADEEFKKHVLAMFLQRDMDTRLLMQQAEAQHVKLEATTIELVKVRAALNEERRTREEMMAVMVAKEKMEMEERVKRGEESRKAEAERKRVQDECAHLHATIARLEMGQQTLREIVEKRFDEDERAKQAAREEKLTMEALEREKMENGEEKVEGEGGEKEKEANSETPSSGVQTPAGGGGGVSETPASRGSGRDRWWNVCYNCHEEGHHSKDCTASPKSEEICDLCGGRGHAASACLPSKRCYNCNKTGHRHYECTEQGTRRCFHCRKVGHLAMHCKNAPSQ